MQEEGQRIGGRLAVRRPREQWLEEQEKKGTNHEKNSVTQSTVRQALERHMKGEKETRSREGTRREKQMETRSRGGRDSKKTRARERGVVEGEISKKLRKEHSDMNTYLCWLTSC
jgi:hypothetical protein